MPAAAPAPRQPLQAIPAVQHSSDVVPAAALASHTIHTGAVQHRSEQYNTAWMPTIPAAAPGKPGSRYPDWQGSRAPPGGGAKCRWWWGAGEVSTRAQTTNASNASTVVASNKGVSANKSTSRATQAVRDAQKLGGPCFERQSWNSAPLRDLWIL